MFAKYTTYGAIRVFLRVLALKVHAALLRLPHAVELALCDVVTVLAVARYVPWPFHIWIIWVSIPPHGARTTAIADPCDAARATRLLVVREVQR